MKCLTICQPYAHLIMLSDDHDRAKRVENRSWYNGFTGESQPQLHRDDWQQLR